WSTRGLAAIFQASACSRPPEPRMRIFMGAVVYQAARRMAQPRGPNPSRSFESFAVLLENLRHLGGRRTAKPAISRKPEVRQVFARGCNPLREARRVVEIPEIDAGPTRPEIGERREKRVIAAIKHRNVHPVDAPGRRCDQ